MTRDSKMTTGGVLVLAAVFGIAIYRPDVPLPPCPVPPAVIPVPAQIRPYHRATAKELRTKPFWETHVAMCPDEMREVDPSRREAFQASLYFTFDQRDNWVMEHITCVPDGLGKEPKL